MTALADYPDNLLPPYATLLGVVVTDAVTSDGLPILSMAYSDVHAGRPGMLHGGAIAGLMDMAAHAALTVSMIRSGQAPRFKPIGITIDYVRGGRQQPTLARARITRVGKRVATVVAEAWQDDPAQPIAAARLHMMLTGE